MTSPSRRARQAAAMTLAASASLRALPLRRVLLVIVFMFVLLPLLVYNVAITLDYDVSATSSSALFRGAVKTADPFYQHQQKQREPLPRCLNVSSAAFLSSEGLAQVQSECGAANASSVVPLKTGGNHGEAGIIVHFIHVPLDAVPLLEGEQAVEKETVTFLQFAAVQSVRKLVSPRVMVLHYVDKEPRGVWYTQCQRHLSLHKVLAPKIAAKATTTGREAAKPNHHHSPSSSSLNIYQRRQLMEFLIMLRVLQKQGGIAFSDFNTFVLRDTLQSNAESSLGRRVVIASQASTRNHGGTEGNEGKANDDGVFRVGVHTLQAPANHQLLKYLEHELLALIAKDDPRLRKLPLEDLVGQLTLAKYKQEHAVKTTADKEEQQTVATMPATAEEEAAMRDVVVGSSLLFEGMPQHRVLSLLSAQVGKDAAQVNFRGVSAFHLDKYDFQLKRNDTEPLRVIQSLEHKILAAGDILEDEDKEPRSLFNALLRFAVGLNTTAELDPYFD